jgi:hypothetical protein
MSADASRRELPAASEEISRGRDERRFDNVGSLIHFLAAHNADVALV